MTLSTSPPLLVCLLLFAVTITAGCDADAAGPSCGNGRHDPSEACESLLDGKGCTATCAPAYGYDCSPTLVGRCQPACGDSIVVAGECDGPDACESDCYVDADPRDAATDPGSLCGNGWADPTENCDPSVGTSSGGCTESCEVRTGWACRALGDTGTCWSVCGDGIILDGDCDLFPEECMSDCLPTCGNGQTEGENREQCDDGNDVLHDGCSYCSVDKAFTCEGAPSSCRGPALDPQKVLSTLDEQERKVLCAWMTMLIGTEPVSCGGFTATARSVEECAALAAEQLALPCTVENYALTYNRIYHDGYERLGGSCAIAIYPGPWCTP